MSNWKLVPVWPTKEMRQAVCDCIDDDHQEQIVKDYRAMLAAAPASPARPLTPAQEAAPELLEALKHAVEIAENKRPGTWDDLLPYRVLIAKAEGGNDE